MNNELTIREIKNNIKELEDDLNLYLTLKKINYNKTQPGAIKYKEIITSKSNTNFDKFNHYVIKDEEYDETIYAKTESLLAYQKRLVEKIKSLSNGSPKALITYLREEEKLPWKDISKQTHYSLRQCHRYYEEK